MNWSDIPWAPPARTLRQFAGLWVLFFLGLAGSHVLRHGPTPTAWLCVGLAITVGPLGLCWPQVVRPLFVGAIVLGFPIGWVVSRLMLGGLYYGVFTPMGLVFRLAGRDVLGLKPCPDQASYWQAKPTAADARRYLRQF